MAILPKIGRVTANAEHPRQGMKIPAQGWREVAPPRQWQATQRLPWVSPSSLSAKRAETEFATPKAL